MSGVKNCPNCGAPIEGSKCSFCGTPFVDISCIDIHGINSISFKDGDQVYTARMYVGDLQAAQHPISMTGRDITGVVRRCECGGRWKIQLTLIEV